MSKEHLNEMLKALMENNDKDAKKALSQALTEVSKKVLASDYRNVGAAPRCAKCGSHRDANVHLPQYKYANHHTYKEPEEKKEITKESYESVNTDDKNASAAHKQAQEESKKGYVQHVQRDPETGHHHVSSWYDEHTVASYENGRNLNENYEDPDERADFEDSATVRNSDGPEVVKSTAPSAWASYLINGDESGIDDPEEIKAIHDWLEWVGLGDPVNCEEVGFMAHHDAYHFWPYGADCEEYVFHA